MFLGPYYVLWRGKRKREGKGEEDREGTREDRVKSIF